MLKMESRRPGSGTFNFSEFTHELEEKVVENNQRINCYKGSYGYGKRNGYGRLVYENGDVYKGYWKDNLRDGFGAYRYKCNSAKYKGQWVDNKKHGTGTTHFKIGDRITCDWDKDRMVKTDEGRIEVRDGTLYVGNIEDCERNGVGTMKYHNNCTYEGKWHHDMRHGYGMIRFDNDCFFEGEFDHDRTSGTGALVLPNRLEST
jgi:hypothetical protein